MITSPRLVVLTGGPCVGKTTLLERFQRLGFAVVPEAALQIIAELTMELGPAEQLRWRTRHVVEFQRRILDRQIELEGRIDRTASLVFLDRSRYDGLAYFRFAGVEPPADVLQRAGEGHYTAAFQLAAAPRFDPRLGTGRARETRADAQRIGSLLTAVYGEAGLPPTRVSVMPTSARVDFILHALGEHWDEAPAA